MIYSDWQSSAMVMFARALEIAYREVKKFKIDQNDADVIKMIRRHPVSSKLYELIETASHFYSLSRENPSLYKSSLEYYANAKKKREDNKNIKTTIERMVATTLKISNESVFWHKYRPLIWSFENIEFTKFGKEENLWWLKWKHSEGEPSIESEIEIYYTTLL